MTKVMGCHFHDQHTEDCGFYHAIRISVLPTRIYTLMKQVSILLKFTQLVLAEVEFDLFPLIPNLVPPLQCKRDGP